MRARGPSVAVRFEPSCGVQASFSVSTTLSTPIRAPPSRSSRIPSPLTSEAGPLDGRHWCVIAISPDRYQVHSHRRGASCRLSRLFLRLNSNFQELAPLLLFPVSRLGRFMAYRPHPYVTIPPGATPAANSSPSVHETTLSPINLWADRRRSYAPYTPPASSSYPGQRISLDVPGRPPSRASSAYEEPTRITFPEPQLYRSSSQRSIRRFQGSSYIHRGTKSESILTPGNLLSPAQYSVHSGESRPPSFENTPEVSPFLNEQGTGFVPLGERGVRCRNYPEYLLPVLDYMGSGTSQRSSLYS